jgi:hypothetical protein
VFSGPIEDRLGVRERFDSYSDAVVPAVSVRAPKRCVTTGTESGRCCRRWGFVTQIGSIVIDGGTATARSYCLETLRFHDDTIRQLIDNV